jgi:hypothetical protein
MKYKRKQRVDEGRLLSVRIFIESQVTEKSYSYRAKVSEPSSEPVGSRDQSQRKMAPPKEATFNISTKKQQQPTNNDTCS